MSKSVPIVDFAKCGLHVPNDSDIEQEAIAETGKNLYEAFSTSGFAYLSNHGIPDDKLIDFQNVMEQFFILPDEIKMKYYTKKKTLCYDPIGAFKTYPEKENNLQEGFHLARAGLAGGIFADQKITWPDHPPEFQTKSVEFADVCKQLALRLMKVLGVGMKLKDPLFLCKCHSFLNREGNWTGLKASRYPPVLDEHLLNKNQLRCGEHTDWRSLTLLFQDENGGLQMANSKGEFEDVPPIPGTIVLNIGDELQFWSGGRLKSSVHRVVIPTDPQKQKSIRRSIAYFISADDHVSLREMEFEDGTDEVPKIEMNGERRKEYTVNEYVEKLFTDKYY